MRPSWSEKNEQNTPENLLGIAEVAARLRKSTVERISNLTSRNMNRVFPRLALWKDRNV
jgi:Tat protein secretion system quality control protein TatD with DNase activity